MDEGEVAVGRPTVWASKGWTPDDLDQECNRILDELEAADKPVTWERLALQIGCLPETLRDYRDREEEEGEGAEYSAPLKKAWARIMANIQDLALTSGKPIGAIAWLNANAGWRQGVDVTTGGRVLDMRGLFARASAANTAREAETPVNSDDSGEGKR